MSRHGGWMRALERLRTSASAVSLAGALACAGSAHTAGPPARSAALEPVRELAPLWPRPAAHAEAERRVLWLQAPRPRRAAERVVDGFFEAVRRESLPDLTALSSEEATVEGGPGTVPEPLGKVWAGRFKRLDYAYTAHEAPYRPGEVALFDGDALAALAGTRRYELAPGPSELLAVVTTRDRRRQTGPRHFGRRIEFLLGEGERGLEIRRVFEDFQLP